MKQSCKKLWLKTTTQLRDIALNHNQKQTNSLVPSVTSLTFGISSNNLPLPFSPWQQETVQQYQATSWTRKWKQNLHKPVVLYKLSPDFPLRKNRLCCFICWKLPGNPVTIPCQHNFCTVCIQDHQERTNSAFSCSECVRLFSSRPKLLENSVYSAGEPGRLVACGGKRKQKQPCRPRRKPVIQSSKMWRGRKNRYLKEQNHKGQPQLILKARNRKKGNVYAAVTALKIVHIN